MVRDLFGFCFLLIFAGHGIQAEPRVNVRPAKMKVIAGQEALFICEIWSPVYHTKRITVKWDIVSAKPVKRRHQSYPTKITYISPSKMVSIIRIRKTVKRQNGDQFICQVRANLYKEASGTLHVLRRNTRGSFPRFISPPLVEFNNNGVLTLDCGKTDSHDTDNVTKIWIKDNTILTTIYKEDTNHSVQLTGQDNHAGIFQCVVITSRGTLVSKPMEIEDIDKTGCKDRKGHTVKVGEMYHPYKDDPCTVCICQDKNSGMMCSNENCENYLKPQCLHKRKVEDMCCEYECVNSSCIDRKGHTVAVGEEFNPAGEDPCTLCICQEDPYISSCTSQGCGYPNCPNFIQLNDTCCEFKCIEPDTQGEFLLDVRQVKSNAVIVQWDATFEEDIDAIIVFYSEEIDRLELVKSVTVSRDQNYVVLTPLPSNINYFFKAQGISNPSIASNLAQLTLDATSGNSLALVPGLHDSIIKQIPTAGDQSIVYLNMNNFDAIDHCLIFDSMQCDYLSFYRYMQDIRLNASTQLVKVMTLHFENVKDLRWARAHI